MVKFLERKIASVEQEQLPYKVKTALKNLAEKRAKLFGMNYIKPGQRLGKPPTIESVTEEVYQVSSAATALQTAIKNEVKHSEISSHLQRGATHFHIGRNGSKLHFVQLPANRRGKKYEPLIGYTRWPIHEAK